jgi:hypothetical protein
VGGCCKTCDEEGTPSKERLLELTGSWQGSWQCEGEGAAVWQAGGITCSIGNIQAHLHCNSMHQKHRVVPECALKPVCLHAYATPTCSYPYVRKSALDVGDYGMGLCANSLELGESLIG